MVLLGAHWVLLIGVGLWTFERKDILT
jgi:hypothetical protein